jgi:peptidoglycan lytic transglycosylase G
MRRATISFLSAAVIAVVVLAWWAWSDLHRRITPPAGGVVVTVMPGTSFRGIAQQLQRSGILDHPLLLAGWARLLGADRHVRRGEYRIVQPLSPIELLDLLQSPSHALRWVTIPEGRTVAQVAEILEQAGFGGRDVFLCAVHDVDFLRDSGLPASGAEGYLFPDTYALEWAMSPRQILTTMLRRFRRESAALAQRRVAAGMSEQEMVTLASVIEKETGQAEERALVSGVFHNRMRIGMPLQSDPTVLYALGMPGGKLRHAHLADPSPYNTYVHRGLPPGPIANPGRAALEAAISPAQTDALYFVSRNDGTHEFSASLVDHNRAVQRYQRGHRSPAAGP